MNYFFSTLRARLILLSAFVLTPVCILVLVLRWQYYRFSAGISHEAGVLAQLHRELFVLGFSMMLAIVSALIMAWLIGDRLILKRIRELAEVARRFGEGDHEARNGPNKFADEFGVLSKAFDDMADTLRKRDGQLRQYYTAVNQHAIVSETDLSGDITFVNEKFCEVSGYAKEELIGKNHRMLNSGLHTSDFFESMWQTIASGKVWHGPIRNRRKDGSYYWVISTIAPQLGADGLPSAYFSIRTDITPLLKMEKALLRSEERLGFLINAGPAMIYTAQYKSEGEYITTYVSENARMLFGYEPKDFIDHMGFWSSHIHPNDVPRILDELPALLRNEAHTHEYRFRMPDGTYRWIHDKLRLIRDAQGNPMEVIGCWIDITERKQIELEREQFFRLFNTASDVMCIIDLDGYFRKTNPALQEKLGYSEPELMRKPFIEFIHPDDRQPTLDEVAGHVERGGMAFGFENRYLCNDGTARLLSWRAYFDKKEALIYATATDITVRKKAEALLVAAKQEAERISQAKTEFMSRVTHELRTPLNFILGFAQLLEMESDTLTEMQLDRVKRIINSGWHLRELIDEVLDFERLDTGEMEIFHAEVDLPAVLKQCIEITEMLAAERRIHIAIAPSPPQACNSVRADPARLRQVLLNLLSNAIKFNREGGLVTIKLETVSAGRLRVAISDTGHGIAAGRQQELFRPFSRLDADKAEIPGAGIGLAVSSRLMQLMDGRIGVDSVPGTGSVFWIELPLAESESFII